MSNQKLFNAIRAQLSWVSEIIIQHRNKRFDSGIGVENVSIPTISVGNITTGGTGKTPFIELLIKEIHGLSPSMNIAVVSRGYRRKSSGVVVVSDGNSGQPIASLEQSGDELYMLAKRNPKVVIIASEQRINGARLAQEKYGADCIILDDGFQHRFIHRDLDIVLIDPNTLNQQYCIPFGHLREPKANVRRAQILCGVSGVGMEQLQQLSNPDAVCIVAQNEHSGWLDISMRSSVPKPGGACFTVTAIAHPERFFTSLLEQEIDIVGTKVYNDHHWFTVDDCTDIIEYVRSSWGKVKQHSQVFNPTIITTAKDAVKLEAYQSLFTQAGIEVVVSSIQTSITSGRGLLLDSLKQALTPRHSSQLDSHN